MRVIVIGLGTQGTKRAQIAGTDLVATVDPLNPQAQYRNVSDVPLSDYDAALVCVPDEPKVEILTYLLQNKKHVLIEKPLWASCKSQLTSLQSLANRHHVVCYTAYNHRFEPHFVRMRDLIQSEKLGTIYHCRLFYGNGTARLVRNSLWRDQGAGVLPDLGSHLLDLMDFWFVQRDHHYEVSLANCFENQSPDHAVVINREAQPKIEFEMSLLSWRNHFDCDLYAEKGSAHIRSLCKWGPSQFILRRRVLPSGQPPEEIITLTQSDPTWQLEYAHFKQLIIKNVPTDLSKDIWIHQQLQQLSSTAIAMASPCINV